MPLSIEAELRFGRYDAGGVDPRRPETEPQPFRLFCALVAAAAAQDREVSWVALEWLERLPPPTIHVGPAVDAGRHQAYVVVNDTTNKSGSQMWPGRTNGLRERVGATFATPRLAFVWPGTDPPAQHLAELGRLASGVPYLGRVTSSVRLRVDDAVPATDPSWRPPLRPGTLRDAGVDVAVPYPGSLAALRGLYERGDRAWEAARLIRYVSEAGQQPVPGAPTRRGGHHDLVVLGLAGRTPVDGRHLVRATMALRRAVMSRVADLVGPDHLPVPLHGHEAGADHVAFLGLPFVGDRHADGRLLGLGLALPELPDGDRVVITKAVTDGFDELVGLFRQPVPLDHDPFRARPWGLVPERWTAADRGGAREWVTATPLVLDRFPKRGDRREDLVADALVTAGAPHPEAVTTAAGPIVPGALGWTSRYRGDAGGHRPPRPALHARVRFAEPVVGPLLAGSLRYLGLGLLAPVGDRTAA